VPLGSSPLRLRALVAAVLAVLLVPASAGAAPPPNDGPAFAAEFTPYTAANDRPPPQDQQAVAELVEATGERFVPRCLGPTSFTRTVWYRVPAAEVPQNVTVEALGRTTDVVDLAAFVQPEGATVRTVSTPNACAGLGAGGSDAAEDPVSAVTLDVPARRELLIEVGRRGPVRSADDERVLLSLDAEPLAPVLAPPGDSAGASTPGAFLKKGSRVRLDGSTITEEDPVQAPCPSLSTVWRRVVPSRDGFKLIVVEGSEASTLTTFVGGGPTPTNPQDCVLRSGTGSLRMRVPVKAKQPLWMRIGTDRPEQGTAVTLRVLEGRDAKVIDGGPGGFDPTTGGPGGGFPEACGTADAARARVSGRPLAGEPKQLNRRLTFPLTLKIAGSPLCDVKLELVGPRGGVFAETRAISLRKGRRVVRLPRVRALVRGVYRLRVSALSQLGKEMDVRTTVRGRLKPRKGRRR
jgi:hypothetical protein